MPLTVSNPPESLPWAMLLSRVMSACSRSMRVTYARFGPGSQNIWKSNPAAICSQPEEALCAAWAADPNARARRQMENKTDRVRVRLSIITITTKWFFHHTSHGHHCRQDLGVSTHG